MEEGNVRINGAENAEKPEGYTKSFKSSRRTYFFDVQTNRWDEVYITITESKKRYERDGKSFYNRYKIFLYESDFEKFTKKLESAIEHAKSFIKPGHSVGDETSDNNVNGYNNIDFEDLESVEITDEDNSEEKESQSN